jgi:hypothetical protein
LFVVPSIYVLVARKRTPTADAPVTDMPSDAEPAAV